MNKFKCCILSSFIACLPFFLAIEAACQEISPRGLFVSMIENSPVLSSREGIVQLIDFAKKTQIKTLKELELCKQAGGGVCSVFYYGNLLESPALSDLLIKN